MKARAKTRVQLHVEIDGSVYHEGWKLEDIIKQVSSEAKQKIRTILAQEGCTIVGEPVVKTITTFQD